jgi:Lon protease-like protein
MAGVYELPLFPLNIVLFPGTPIQLHIFETRYIQMVNTCLKEKRPFGVSLILNGLEALGPLAEPHAIGCTAQIAQIEPLAEGRMNLVGLGQERFRILSLDRESQPYLTARVQTYPIDRSDSTVNEQRGVRMRRQFERLMQLLQESGANQLDLNQLPEDNLKLAYLAAAVLQIPSLQKQELLAIQSEEMLLDRLNHIYQRELALLEVLLSRSGELQPGGFSKN